MDEINAFEQELVEGGTTILKCMLHISYDEQRERFLRRLRRDDKRWKFNPSDIETRRLWDEYQAAYGQVIGATCSEHAPWYIIPADHKWYRNWAIAKLLIETFESMGLSYPPARLRPGVATGGPGSTELSAGSMSKRTTPQDGEPTPLRAGAGRPPTRSPFAVWPYTWASLGWFAAAYVAMVGAWTLTGLAVTRWLEPSSLGRAELDLNRWFEDRRTPTRNTLAEIGSIPSDTFVTIGLLAVSLVALPLVWRRWHDWAFLLGALALEVAVYVSSNFLVGRPRPPVERLEEIVTDSFPSGHMAAAVALYVGVVIIASWHTTSRAVLTVAVLAAAVLPTIVAISRLYLGVHYLSDIVAGALLGATAVTVALTIARRGLAEEVAQSPEREPAHAARLDLTDAGPGEQPASP